MSKKILSLITVILLVSLFTCGCGDDGTTTIPVPTPSTNVSTINGIVYNTNGTPASGATVTLTPNMGTSEAYGEVQTTTTGTDGRFSFTVSFAGTYFIEAKLGSTILGSQQFTLSLGSTVTIVLGQASTGTLRVQLTPATALATVTVGMVSSSDEVSAAQAATGEYIFYLPGGTYTFTVNATGYNSVTRTGVVVNVGEETVETVDLTTEEIAIGTLTKLEPRVIVNSNLTTQEIKVTGSNFTGSGTNNDITITLVPVGGGDAIPVSGITVDDPNTVRFTADFTGAANGEYTLTLTHTPITSSSSTETSNIWLTDTIQGAIDEASVIYASEREAGKMTASATDPGWVQAYVPAGTYELGDPEIPTSIANYSMLGLSSGVYFKGAGSDVTGGTHITSPGDRAIFCSWSCSNIALDGFRFTGCNNAFGGVLYANSSTGENLITNCVMTGNTGGAIHYEWSADYININLTITDNTFTENIDAGAGGAIYIYTSQYSNANVTITGNTVSRNSSLGDGGGIYVYYNNSGGECIINNNTITDNYCGDFNGAGLYFYSDKFSPTPLKTVIQNNRITGNYATSSAPLAAGLGGGIYCLSGDRNSVDITGNTISNNGNWQGGGMYLLPESGSTINLSGNNITANAAIDSGGGIYTSNTHYSASAIIADNEISGNGAAKTIGTQAYTETLNGGGIYLRDGTKFHLNRNNVYGNTGTSIDGGEQLYIEDIAGTVVDATNNWWGTGVDPRVDAVVYNDAGSDVTVEPYATGQFTVPVTP